MAALGVSPAQVRQALASNNYLAAVGQTKGQLIQVNLTATTDLQTVEGFKKLVVREREGTLVRLEVLGAVDRVEEPGVAERFPRAPRAEQPPGPDQVREEGDVGVVLELAEAE
jgi:multidrug efflux pump subunit AcrB